MLPDSGCPLAVIRSSHLGSLREACAVNVRRTSVIVLVLGLAGCAGRLGPESERDAVVAAIENLQGSVEYDEESSDRPIVGVDFWDRFWVTDADLEVLKNVTSLQRLIVVGTKVTDAGLEHLKGLTSLQALNLGETQVTDAGLEHLKGLTSLRRLGLYGTQVTDAGLEHLKHLPHVSVLNLGNTQVTDAGLEHLKGLTKLETLKLDDTQVTEEGIKKLQEALPDCEIQHSDINGYQRHQLLMKELQRRSEKLEEE
jgi:hypothetical protein